MSPQKTGSKLNFLFIIHTKHRSHETHTKELQKNIRKLIKNVDYIFLKWIWKKKNNLYDGQTFLADTSMIYFDKYLYEQSMH